jgi:hypothetical protein
MMDVRFYPRIQKHIMSTSTKPSIFSKCNQCGTDFTLKHVQTWKQATGRATVFYCSKSCAMTWKHQNNQQLRDALRGQEMKVKLRDALKSKGNWLQTPEAVEKNRQKRIESGIHRGKKIKNRGGNGHGLTTPQKMLAEALQWQTEYVLKTGATRGSGMPYHYRLDLANPVLRIAIEVDGRSHLHYKVKASDQRKDEFLKLQGWRVLRFLNQQVIDDLAGCAQMAMSMTSRSMETTTSLPKAS